MRPTISVLSRLAMLAVLPLVFYQANAQTYPAKTVRFLVGFPAGGATDISARAIAGKLNGLWKQQVIIENKPGASGVIAAEVTKSATADGYTVLFGSSNEMTVRPNLVRKMSFDPRKDFAPVSLAIVTPAIVLVNPSLPVKSVKDLIDLAKRRPGELSYAATGPGSPHHMAGELFKIMSGTDIVYVPYKGAAPAVADLLGGHVPIAILTMAGMMQHVESGRLRALAVTTTKRSPIAPDVPTMEEGGLKGFDMSQWFGVFVPAGTPKDVIATISKGVSESLKASDLREALLAQALEPVGSTPEEFAKFLRVELDKNAKIANAANVKID